MDSKATDSQPPRPAVNGETENAALATQVLDTRINEKDVVGENADEDRGASAKAKKASEASMKNYFVSIFSWSNS
jgi:hypothetical protein